MSGPADAKIALALAGGAVAIELLETLHEKGILDLNESRAVLDRGMKALAPHALTGNGAAAQRIIGEKLKTKFSQRG